MSQSIVERTWVERWLVSTRLDRSPAYILATSAVFTTIALRLEFWELLGNIAVLLSFTLAILVVAVIGQLGPVALAAGQSIAAAITILRLKNAPDLDAAELMFFAMAVLLIMILTEVIDAGRRAIDRAEELIKGRDMQLRTMLDMFPDATMVSATDGTARVADFNQLDELVHELNQPLAAINNYSDGCTRMLREMDDSFLTPLRQALEEIESQSLRAGQLMNRFKDLWANGEVQKAPVEVLKLMKEALHLGLPASETEGIKIRLGYQPGTFKSVIVDRILVQQVIINLVRNAVEAMRHVERRELYVLSHTSDRGEVAVIVMDTGGGISEEVADNLFEPFATTKANGRGLGLAVSKRILDAHGTEMTFSSNEDGGTTFRFTLQAYGDERI
ncbi:sensor histidine kinase [Sinorhizobium meliloti]|uniref:sensor histidine kinase n=1 Tax=Rhizobium meliloti TaxID=382 RepID=UPI0002FBD3EB|nr:sensor histidine kinase [Sinorhizobium meliloti]